MVLCNKSLNRLTSSVESTKTDFICFHFSNKYNFYISKISVLKEKKIEKIMILLFMGNKNSAIKGK